MVTLGDMLSGYTPEHVLVAGTVVDTGDSRVEIEGITVTDTRRGRYTVRLSDVLTSVHTRAQVGLS